MTFYSSFVRLVCLLGPYAWLFLHVAVPLNAVPDGSQDTNAKPIVHFTDIAQKAGLTTPVIFGGENTKKYIIETTGTGVAIFDYDNDGWPDIFVVYGSKPETLSKGKNPGSHIHDDN